MKTIRQWLADSLTISALDFDYINKYFKANLDAEADSFEDALGGGFVWATTKQGNEYWKAKIEAEKQATNDLYEHSAE